jgi:hypothetical protein
MERVSSNNFAPTALCLRCRIESSRHLSFVFGSLDKTPDPTPSALALGVFFFDRAGATRYGSPRASVRRACTIHADQENSLVSSFRGISLVRRWHESECSEKVIDEYINRSGRSKKDWIRRICRHARVTGTSGWSDACLPYRSGAGRG